MVRMRLTIMQISGLYFLLFLGFKNVIGVILSIILSPILPSILSLLSEPGSTFSSIYLAPFLLQIIGLIVSIFVSIRITKIFSKIQYVLKVAGLTTIFYIIYTLLPTVRFLFINQAARNYLFYEKSSDVIYALGINSVFFILFFLLTVYFLKLKKGKGS